MELNQDTFANSYQFAVALCNAVQSRLMINRPGFPEYVKIPYELLNTGTPSADFYYRMVDIIMQYLVQSDSALQDTFDVLPYGFCQIMNNPKFIGSPANSLKPIFQFVKQLNMDNLQIPNPGSMVNDIVNISTTLPTIINKMHTVAGIPVHEYQGHVYKYRIARITQDLSTIKWQDPEYSGKYWKEDSHGNILFDVGFSSRKQVLFNPLPMMVSFVNQCIEKHKQQENVQVLQRKNQYIEVKFIKEKDTGISGYDSYAYYGFEIDFQSYTGLTGFYGDIQQGTSLRVEPDIILNDTSMFVMNIRNSSPFAAKINAIYEVYSKLDVRYIPDPHYTYRKRIPPDNLENRISQTMQYQMYKIGDLNGFDTFNVAPLYNSSVAVLKDVTPSIEGFGDVPLDSHTNYDITTHRSTPNCYVLQYNLPN